MGSQLLSQDNKKVIRLLLIRHGESASNVEPDVIGGRQITIPLTKKGRDQASSLGKYLVEKEVVFARYYTLFTVLSLFLLFLFLRY